VASTSPARPSRSRAHGRERRRAEPGPSSPVPARGHLRRRPPPRRDRPSPPMPGSVTALAGPGLQRLGLPPGGNPGRPRRLAWSARPLTPPLPRNPQNGPIPTKRPGGAAMPRGRHQEHPLMQHHPATPTTDEHPACACAAQGCPLCLAGGWLLARRHLPAHQPGLPPRLRARLALCPPPSTTWAPKAPATPPTTATWIRPPAAPSGTCATAPTTTAAPERSNQ
jgi:hypothetical protein